MPPVDSVLYENEIENLYISRNPFIQHCLTVLRDKDCTGAVYREKINKIATYLVLEAA